MGFSVELHLCTKGHCWHGSRAQIFTIVKTKMQLVLRKISAWKWTNLQKMNVCQILNWNLIFGKFEETPHTRKYEKTHWRKRKWQRRGNKAKRQFLPRKTKQASRKKIKQVCHLLKSQKRTKVSQRFFPILKWTTNSWRGIKKPLKSPKQSKATQNQST